MGDTNYFSGIVKILETPSQTFIYNKAFATKFRVEIPQTRKSKMMTLIFWGNLADEVKNYYQTNDYILIEGYISISKKNLLKVDEKLKTITVTVLKVYPFLLNSTKNRLKN